MPSETFPVLSAWSALSSRVEKIDAARPAAEQQVIVEAAELVWVPEGATTGDVETFVPAWSFELRRRNGEGAGVILINALSGKPLRMAQ